MAQAVAQKQKRMPVAVNYVDPAILRQKYGVAQKRVQKEKVKISAVKSGSFEKKIEIRVQRFFQIAGANDYTGKEYVCYCDDPGRLQVLEKFMSVIRAKIKFLGQYHELTKSNKEDLISMGVTAFYEVVGEQDNVIISHIRKSMDCFLNREVRQGELEKELGKNMETGNSIRRHGKNGVNVVMCETVDFVSDANRIRGVVDQLEGNGDDVAIAVIRAKMANIQDREIPEHLGITRKAFVQAILRIQKTLTSNE